MKKFSLFFFYHINVSPTSMFLSTTKMHEIKWRKTSMLSCINLSSFVSNRTFSINPLMRGLDASHMSLPFTHQLS